MFNTSVIVAVFILLNAALLIHDFEILKFLFDDRHPWQQQQKVKRRNSRADFLVLAGILICIAAPVINRWNATLAYLTVIAGLGICLLAAFRKIKTREEIN
jgi:hypothetical protein